MLKKLLIVSSLLCSVSTLASVTVLSDDVNTIRLSVEEKYTLGDNDTLTSAKAINIEQVKKTATDYAGTYVESELQVSNNAITKQQVRVLTAGYIEVFNREDERTIGSNGSVILKTKAEVILSKESIRDGLAKLKSDPERKAKIKTLENENARLRNQLGELTKKINTGQSRTDLMAARSQVLKDLDKNREASKQVFEEGTLFQLAMLDGNEYELAKQDIDENVLGYLSHEVHVSTGKPKFIKQASRLYDLTIPVKWTVNKTPVVKVLQKYFHEDRYFDNGHMGKRVPNSFGVNRYQNSDGKAKHQYTENLFKYLSSKTIAIELDAGGYKGYLPLAAMTGGISNSTFAIQFSDSKELVRGQYRNPVLISDLSESKLKAITAISAKVVMLDAGDLRRWKYD